MRTMALWIVILVGVLLRAPSAGCDVCTEPSLSKVFFADVHTGYAIGTTSDTSIVFKTSDGGITWLGVYEAKLPLYGIYFRAPDQGWIVGGAGAILSTSNAGRTWEKLSSGADQDLLDITADSAGAMFVVGNRATLLTSPDGGHSWTRLSVPTTVDLTGVASLPSGMLLVLGRDRLLTSLDSGATWTTHGPYKWDTLSRLAFVDDSLGFLTSGLLFRTTDGGNTLTFLPLSETEHVGPVRVTESGTYVVLGSAETGGTVHIPGEALPSHSAILKTTDNGRTWDSVYELKDERTHKAFLTDLFFIGEHGWAVGAEGTVVFTEDAGKHWQQGHVKGCSDSLNLRFPGKADGAEKAQHQGG